MRWYQHIIPTYGNWGGPGFSSGKYTDDPKAVDWESVAVDDMDEAFKTHDHCYQRCGHPRWVADRALFRRLKTTNVRGIWPNGFRYASMLIFWIRGRP